MVFSVDTKFAIKWCHKSIGWYQAFVVLLIQTDIAKNNIDTDTGIGIGASLQTDKFVTRLWHLCKIFTILYGGFEVTVQKIVNLIPHINAKVT